MLPHAVVLKLQAATSAELGYVMSLPDGFVSIPAEFAGARDVVGCWAGEGSQSSQGSFVLCVQRMHATLGREHLKSSDLPASSQLLTVKWQGLDIDAIRTDTSQAGAPLDRKSTRLNSSHMSISYAVFCLKKKKKTTIYFSFKIKKKKYNTQ